MPSLKIAIVGAGIGGLTAAVALRQAGHDVTVFERTPAFGRVGADINLTPNVVRALDGLGLRKSVEQEAARTTSRNSRAWDTGELLSTIPMSDEAEKEYGAPQLTIHRADLLSALETAVPSNLIRLGSAVVDIDDRDPQQPTVVLEDGTRFSADIIIGSDGIHSMVRTWMLGEDKPRFTGVVSFRAVFPAERIAGHPALGTFTKWWGPTPDIELVTFPLARGEEVFVFATVGKDDWTEESWTTPGSVSEFREVYADFHEDAVRLVDSCDEVLKSALHERDPLPTWTKGQVTLLGDACHPMLPFMAQGAGSAIEDAVILARCLSDENTTVLEALSRYEATRKPRTSKIQLSSRTNEWLKDDAGDASWVYGYDVWNAPLESTPPSS